MSSINPLRLIRNKIIRIILILIIVLGGILYLTARANVFTGQKTLSSIQTNSGQKTKIAQPLSVQAINREFNFPIKDNKGATAGTLKYIIEKAETRDEIIVKGQKATAIEGRTFLIVTLKITNEGNKRIEVNSRDFVRLSVNNKPEWLAPDVHNDPVEIQPISTKYSRLGFPINEGDNNLKIQVGEITGEKTVLDLQF